MRAAAIAFAKELNLLPFRYARLGRYMSHFQADALVPFGKAFFGAGIGNTMLKKAMAGREVGNHRSMQRIGRADEKGLLR